MATHPDQWTIAARQVSLVERYSTTLFPVDILTLLDALPHEGWVVPTKHSPEGGMSLEQSPSKGNNRLVINQGSKTIGITGGDVQEVLQGFRDFKQRLLSLWDFSSEVKTDYVELRYVGWIKGQSNPVEVFANLWRNNPASKQIGSILSKYMPAQGLQFGAYGIRFARLGQDANRPAWSELTLVPEPSSGHVRYAFDLIFRDPVAAVVEDVTERANDMMKAILGAVESAPHGTR